MHAIYKVRAFQRIGPFTLRISFDDSSWQSIDFRPVLAGELYGPLNDPSLFNQVYIDPEIHTLVWPNGADFDPETLHDWPRYEPELTARAKRWAAVPR